MNDFTRKADRIAGEPTTVRHLLVVLVLATIGCATEAPLDELEGRRNCGDGTCSRRESCESCPSDCGVCTPDTPDPAFSITNVSAGELTDASATISWDLSEGGTGQVQYGTTTEYGSLTSLEPSYTYAHHVQTLSGLNPATLYHFRITSTNAGGEVAVSPDHTFSTGGMTSTGSTIYPPLTSMSVLMPPSVARPAYRVPTIDPTFRTTVTRVSDETAFGTTKAQAMLHHYSKNQPWNSDGSLIRLGGWPGAVLDGKTYQFLRWVMPPQKDSVWSNINPKLVYGVQGANQFVKVDMTTGTTTVVHTFSAFADVYMGNYEGNISNDDHYAAFIAKTSTGVSHIVVYDLWSDSVVATKQLPSAPDNVTMSQSGNHVVVQWGNYGTSYGQGAGSFDRSLTTYQFLNSNGRNHGDVCYDAAGNENWVAVGNTISGSRLSDGVTTAYLSGLDGGQHISCRNLSRPGWAYVSWFAGYVTGFQPGENETYALKLDGSGKVQRFAHTHVTDNLSYEANPMAVPNRDGSKVMFKTDWETGSNIYTYIAEMK